MLDNPKFVHGSMIDSNNFEIISFKGEFPNNENSIESEFAPNKFQKSLRWGKDEMENNYRRTVQNEGLKDFLTKF
jgi:hypothetical protein